MPQSIKNILQVHRPTSVTSPLVFDSPHSGEFYPDDFKACVPASLYKRAEDRYVHELFEKAPETGGVFLEALFARIYIDLNRSSDNISPQRIKGWRRETKPDSRSDLGKGLIWTEASPTGEALYDRELSVGEIENRIDSYYTPYYDALTRLMEQAQTKFGVAYHLDCHSMQQFSTVMYEDGAGQRRPDITLSDRDGTTCDPEYIQAARDILNSLGYDVKINDPYKGAELIIHTGRPSQNWHAVQIEVNRGLYLNEETLEKLPNFENLQRDLGAFVMQLSAYTKQKIHQPQS
ncbi:N-formylglutamate amidohydrolase [Pseudovibrio axinellae]|uniref:N-formylglutamate amidohydrolase n=1 Tax=Pseudovibrio axinellae TaxID=989403 RepID=A0A165Z5P6_9HYPH|nr:N-formylglutamate amidohydrolase [Pseudovibrio axinellae]KZL19532.1 N-formylglutamate amidohydrolase [Pseudovibrio axinellae]SEQ30792.1 N-formylglutamate amidohydrolase [Pseudovibrio axinellae]